MLHIAGTAAVPGDEMCGLVPHAVSGAGHEAPESGEIEDWES